MEMVFSYTYVFLTQLIQKINKGDLINIPVLMVKKRDGDIIKEFLLSENKTIAKSVVLSISFELVCYYFNFIS